MIFILQIFHRTAVHQKGMYSLHRFIRVFLWDYTLSQYLEQILYLRYRGGEGRYER